MYPLKQSAALAVLFWAQDEEGDPVTGLSDGDWTKSISKNGVASLSSMTVTVTEAGKGWYGISLSGSHTDTNGVLSLSFEATGVKQVNMQFRVSPYLVDDVMSSLTTLASSIASLATAITNLSTKVGTPAGASVSIDVAALKTAVDSHTADLADLLDHAFGRWKVSGTQLLLYRASDNDEVWKAFDLFDESGSASGVRVFDRIPTDI